MQNNDCIHVIKKWKQVKGSVVDIDCYTGNSVVGTKFVGTCELCKQQVSKFKPSKKGKHLGLKKSSQN